MSPYYEEDGITIYHGDCREIWPVVVTPGSVDLVLTDPPYPIEFLSLYGWLAQSSRSGLRVGGNLVSLCGHYQLPDVLDLVRPHLRYWWIGGMQQHTSVHLMGKDVVIRFKPALWFVKEKHDRTMGSPTDMLFLSGRDKRFHKWGQGSEWFVHWIDKLAPAGGLVVDPFMGAGTTLYAAKAVGRRAIGIELEERYCEIAVQRLAQGVLNFSTIEGAT